MGPETSGPVGLVGRVIGGYRLERVLGTGVTGAVLLGRHSDAPDRLAAIRVLMLPLQVSAAARVEFRERFAREAHTLFALRHPHIPRVYAFGEDVVTDFAYMALPYMPGGSLAEKLASGALPLVQIATQLRQLAAALDYAHGRGAIHGDVKPANVLYDEQGQVYLADFGIARLFEAVYGIAAAAGLGQGTAAYIAPEQAMGEPVSPATDIYSLGIVLYEMVTGRVPFAGASAAAVMLKHLQQDPPDPRSLRPDLPEAAAAAILRALAKAPEARFATAAALADAFAHGIGCDSDVVSLDSLDSHALHVSPAVSDGNEKASAAPELPADDMPDAAGAPCADESPGDESPGDESPGDESPGDESPGDAPPEDESSADELLTDEPSEAPEARSPAAETPAASVAPLDFPDTMAPPQPTAAMTEPVAAAAPVTPDLEPIRAAQPEAPALDTFEDTEASHAAPDGANDDLAASTTVATVAAEDSVAPAPTHVEALSIVADATIATDQPGAIVPASSTDPTAPDASLESPKSPVAIETPPAGVPADTPMPTMEAAAATQAASPPQPAIPAASQTTVPENAPIRPDPHDSPADTFSRRAATAPSLASKPRHTAAWVRTLALAVFCAVMAPAGVAVVMVLGIFQALLMAVVVALLAFIVVAVPRSSLEAAASERPATPSVGDGSDTAQMSAPPDQEGNPDRAAEMSIAR